jgi:hypothetical protein
MIKSRTINTIPGFYIAIWAGLNGTRVISADRSGHGHDEVTGTGVVPSNTEFRQFGANIIFDPLIPFNVGEKVHVIYEE